MNTDTATTPDAEPTFTFEHDGQTWTLEYDFEALCRLEAEMDMGIYEIAPKLMASPRLDLLRATFWAGLLKHHGKLITYPEAGVLFLTLGAPRAGALIGGAIAPILAQLTGSPEADLEAVAEAAATRERKAARKAAKVVS